MKGFLCPSEFGSDHVARFLPKLRCGDYQARGSLGGRTIAWLTPYHVKPSKRDSVQIHAALQPGMNAGPMTADAGSLMNQRFFSAVLIPLAADFTRP